MVHAINDNLYKSLPFIANNTHCTFNVFQHVNQIDFDIHKLDEHINHGSSVFRDEANYS